ncbi:ABC transporter ATP-binding protein [Corynebacterium sp.]|uniref:dipeptide ABC transporter ATP-binding protein n=1 Tax=Corynebacterium sp. TaxID=1720 RepID=UPI0025C27EE4|nr:ABC transporter ATP-binding protein [Corynebacterium sp.]
MSDATSPLLSLRNVDIAFGTRKNPLPTVFDVNFDIWPGETVAVVGESGSGKSTTAMSIMGLLPGGGHVTDGTITFDGRDITHLSEREFTGIRGSEVGLVPQDPMSNLNPVWSVGHHIKEALKANNVASGSAAHDRAVELMEEAGLTEADRRINQFPHQFSGGQRQRALIGCGLAARPKLLIADEPTSALDVTVQQQILDHLQGLTEELGTAVLLITHDLGLAAERAQRIIVMSQGRIVEAGPSLEILQNPQHPYTQKLVASAPSVAARRIDLDIEEPLRDSGEDAEEASPNLIEVSGLTKIYQVPGDRPWRKKDFTAAEDVNFFLREGRTLALVGESGSGKSTVAQMVLGLLEPTSGTVSFDGTDVTHLDRAGELAFRRRVQPVFQNPYGSVDPMYSVFNTIAEPLKIHKVGSKKEQEARVRELLDLVAMPSSMLSRYPGELSGGQRQRVAIARALALGPEALILDEAVSALDVLVQSQVLSLLNDLQDEMGLTYLFITHDLAVVKQIADETLVMKSGRIVERGETDALFDNPEQEYTRRLIESIPGGTLPLYQG